MRWVRSPVSCGGAVQLSTAASFGISVANAGAGNLISSTGGNVNLITDSLTLSNNAGNNIQASASNTIFVQPATANGNVGTVSGADASKMSAQTIQFGNNATFAGIGGATSYNGNILIAAGAFSPTANLVYASSAAGTFTNNGNVSVPGADTITVSVGAGISNSATASLAANQVTLSSTNGSIGAAVQPQQPLTLQLPRLLPQPHPRAPTL